MDKKQSYLPNLFEKRFGLFLILPAVIILSLILIGPIIYTLFLSFHSWYISAVSSPSYAGVDNYIRIFNDSRFYHALKVTGIFTIGGLIFQVILGVGLAQFLYRGFKGRPLVRSLLILPMAATPVAVALIWRLMLHPTLGILNYFIQSLGLEAVTWLSSPRLVMLTLIAVDTWKWTPLIMLVAMAGMTAIPKTLYEAGKIDGASDFQLFTFITLPLIRPAVVVAAMIRFMDSLKEFDMIYTMTQGGPGFASQILNLYTFDNAFRYFRMGYASSIIVIMFLIIFFATLILVKIRRTGR